MRRKAFTLVELLVVIAIIGLLSTIGAVALDSSRKKARNAKRVADIKQLVSAFSMGVDANGSYPAGTACISTTCTGTLSWLTHDAVVDAFLAPFIATPADPANSSRDQGGYVYVQNWVDGGASFPPGPYLHYFLEPPGTCGVGAAFSSNAQTVSCVVRMY